VEEEDMDRSLRGSLSSVGMGSDRSNRIQQGLRVDPQRACQQIEAFLRAEVKRLNKRGVVLGLSGGLDSSVCAALCVRALGRRRVRVLLLPERDSDPGNTQDSRHVAEMLGLKPTLIELSPLMDLIGVYGLFSENQAGNREAIQAGLRWIACLMNTASPFGEGLSLLYPSQPGVWGWLLNRLLWRPVGRIHAFAMGKVRLRMLLLHFHAMQENCLVVGTTDRSEWSIGFFDKYGDAAVDVMLLQHLYKTQIRVLAEYLDLPPRVISKPSSGDLAAGLPNEAAIGLTYEQLDGVLWGLEHGFPAAELSRLLKVPRRAVAGVRKASHAAQVRAALPARLESPAP
jgi:NAD+ synthase